MIFLYLLTNVSEWNEEARSVRRAVTRIRLEIAAQLIRRMYREIRADMLTLSPGVTRNGEKYLKADRCLDTVRFA